MRKLFMGIFTVIFIAVWIGAGLLFHAYEYHEIWCALLGFFIAACVDWLLSTTVFYLIKFFPIIIQKPFYLAWKENLLVTNAKADALIAYPMAAFIELELDKHFEEGGIIAAENALFNRINDMGEALLKPINDAIEKLKEKK